MSSAPTLARVLEQLRAKGHAVPSSVAEISPFPVSSFGEMRELLRAGALRLSRFSVHFDQSAFELVANRGERVLKWVGIGVGYGGVIAAAVLAFALSWWCALLGLLLFPGMALAKRVYNTAILRSAFESESAFCFLYYIRQVLVRDELRQQTFYYDAGAKA